jgi:rod shape determining protein RodA
MIVDRRLLPHLDWTLIAAVLALAFIGLLTVYSVTADVRTGAAGSQFWTQVYALPLAIVAMGICLVIDYRALTQRSLLIYGGLVALLVFVAFFGVVRGGSRRWLVFGPLSLQPSEFARIALALVLAMYYGETRRSARTLGGLVVGAVALAVLALLIYPQPDLGTPLMLIPVFVGVAFVAGLPVRWLGVAALVAVLLSPLVWTYALQDYHRERIEIFFDPSKAPRGAGYQQIQAKVTVGSGGLFGKGFGRGTQSSYGFLPVAYNDFVFSAFAEENGFLGVLVALGLYLFVIVRSLDAARLAKDRVGAFLVVALISGFAFQVVYNITMSAGLAPVKGLTLPLMSSGGSSLLSTYAAFGLILNVRMRRFTN